MNKKTIVIGSVIIAVCAAVVFSRSNSNRITIVKENAEVLADGENPGSGGRWKTVGCDSDNFSDWRTYCCPSESYDNCNGRVGTCPHFPYNGCQDTFWN